MELPAKRAPQKQIKKRFADTLYENDFLFSDFDNR